MDKWALEKDDHEMWQFGHMLAVPMGSVENLPMLLSDQFIHHTRGLMYLMGTSECDELGDCTSR